MSWGCLLGCAAAVVREPYVSVTGEALKTLDQKGEVPGSPGAKLREIRNRLEMSVRDVAEQSQAIAEYRGDPEYLVSAPWLTQLENNKGTTPSIFKIFSLACIYGVKYSHLLLLYNVDVHDPAFVHASLLQSKTHIVDFDSESGPPTLELPIRFEMGTNLSRTTLLSRTIEEWGRVPVEFVQRLDRRHRLYGYIGAKDFTLHPLIKPSSFVEIDPEDRKLEAYQGGNEIDRPIYFVDLHREYACGWCELQTGRLLVLAHPSSPCETRIFAYPDEAEIVGRVTAIAMRLHGSSQWEIHEASKALRRPQN